MAEDNRRFKSTAELAFVNFSGEIQSLPQERYGTVSGEQRKRINQGIDECMRGAIDDAIRRPNPITGNGSLPTVSVGVPHPRGVVRAPAGATLDRCVPWQLPSPRRRSKQ
jgi:hypothetical protein